MYVQYAWQEKLDLWFTFYYLLSGGIWGSYRFEKFGVLKACFSQKHTNKHIRIGIFLECPAVKGHILNWFQLGTYLDTGYLVYHEKVLLLSQATGRIFPLLLVTRKK